MNVSSRRSRRTDLLAPGEAVAARQHDDARLGHQRDELQVGLVERHVDEGEVDLGRSRTVSTMSEKSRSRISTRMLGWPAGEPCEQRRQTAPPGGGSHRADHERARLAAGQRPRPAPARRRPRRGSRGPRCSSRLPGRGELDATGRAHQQRPADLALQARAPGADSADWARLQPRRPRGRSAAPRRRRRSSAADAGPSRHQSISRHAQSCANPCCADVAVRTQDRHR